jgi:CRP-like cAMP-binding protein
MRTETTTVDDLLTRTALQRFPAGCVLFEEGQLPIGVYILHSGNVTLGNGVTARAGEILGLMAVISGTPHSTSAVAASPCEVGFIERDEFRDLVDQSPAIWFTVLRQMSQDVYASNDVIRERSARAHC